MRDLHGSWNNKYTDLREKNPSIKNRIGEPSKKKKQKVLFHGRGGYTGHETPKRNDAVTTEGGVARRGLKHGPRSEAPFLPKLLTVEWGERRWGETLRRGVGAPFNTVRGWWP